MAKKKVKKVAAKVSEPPEPIEPNLKDAEKVAPRDYANDPAWLRYLLNEFLAVLPEEIEFREDADPERCANVLGFLEHVKLADQAPEDDEEE